MDQLIQLVTQKANISEEQARTAVTTVLGFLKEKLPPPVAGQLDSIVAGGSPDLGDLAGGLFGRQ